MLEHLYTPFSHQPFSLSIRGLASDSLSQLPLQRFLGPLNNRSKHREQNVLKIDAYTERADDVPKSFHCLQY